MLAEGKTRNLRANQKGQRRGLKNRYQNPAQEAKWVRLGRSRKLGIAPGEVGRDEAGGDLHPEVEIPRPREAGDGKAEGGLAAQETSLPPSLVTELRLPKPPLRLPQRLTSRRTGTTMQGWGAARCRSHPPLSRPSSSREKGSALDRTRGWKQGHQETSFRGSPGFQGHQAQLSALWNPSKQDVGEEGQRPFPAA